MTYTPRSWADGELVAAEDLNRIEQALTEPRTPTAHTHDLGDVAGLAARLAALEYTTGWRVLPNPPGVLGDVVCIRDTSFVTVQASNVRGAAGQIEFGTLPLGMRPRGTVIVPAPGGGNLTIAYTGLVYLSGQDNANAWRSATVTFRVVREDVRPNPPFSPA